MNDAQTLIFMGYVIDRDFIASADGVVWLSEAQQPTTEQIESARHPAALAIVTQRIRAECERRQFEMPVPVIVGGTTYRFQADRDSRGRYAILGNTIPLLMMQGATMTTPLLDAQGTQVTWWTEAAQPGGAKVACPMTVGVYLALVQAAMGRESALDSAYRAHVQAAAASADPLAYDYSGNWPA